MKKILIFLLFIFVFSANSAMANDDLWDNFGDQNVYNQKPVSDKEFNSVLDKLKNRTKKKEKIKDKDLKGGESFQQSSETDFIKNIPAELPVLLVPLNLTIKDDAILPIGHYQIKGQKENGKIYLKFYQSQDLMASIPAIETTDDFNQPSINFVKLIEHTSNQIKIIYGSIDFNAYAVVDIAPQD